jgi:hypothetical protein
MLHVTDTLRCGVLLHHVQYLLKLSAVMPSTTAVRIVLYTITLQKQKDKILIHVYTADRKSAAMKVNEASDGVQITLITRDVYEFLHYLQLTKRERRMSVGGTRWRSWSRHYAPSPKVAGWIPDGVIGIFHWLHPSGLTMALRSTQPLIWNEYQGYLLGVKVGRCAGLTTLPPSCADCLELPGASDSWSPKGLSRHVKWY